MAAIVRLVRCVALFLVSAFVVSAGLAGATAAAAAPQSGSLAAEPVLRGEVSCDQLNARNRVSWKLAGDDTGDVVDFSVTPPGSTLGSVQSLVVGSPGFPVAVQTVPLGATSASASLTVHWWSSPGSTVTGSVTFSPRCGPSQPWATFMWQCDHVSTVITMGNAASAPGAAELTVQKTRDGTSVVGVYFVMPGQQRTVTIGEPALLEVIQYDTAHIGNDFYVTNFNTPPNPNCGDGGEPIRPDVPGQQPGGGGSGGGSGSTATASADPTVTATPTAASSASNSDGPFVVVQTKDATSAANGAPEQGRSFAALGWTVAAVAVLTAAGGLLAWLRLRRRRTVPTQPSTGE